VWSAAAKSETGKSCPGAHSAGGFAGIGCRYSLGTTLGWFANRPEDEVGHIAQLSLLISSKYVHRRKKSLHNDLRPDSQSAMSCGREPLMVTKLL
jgi:hypothetical protein